MNVAVSDSGLTPTVTDRAALVELSSQLVKTYRVPAGPLWGVPNVTVHVAPEVHWKAWGDVYPEPGAQPVPEASNRSPLGEEETVTLTVVGGIVKIYAAPLSAFRLSAAPFTPVALPSSK